MKHTFPRRRLAFCSYGMLWCWYTCIRWRCIGGLLKKVEWILYRAWTEGIPTSPLHISREICPVGVSITASQTGQPPKALFPIQARQYHCSMQARGWALCHAMSLHEQTKAQQTTPRCAEKASLDATRLVHGSTYRHFYRPTKYSRSRIANYKIPRSQTRSKQLAAH